MVNAKEFLGREVSLNSTDDRDIFFLISKVRHGISYALFESMLKTGPFTFDEWSNYLNLSERTLQRYKKENKPFQSTFAERILEIMLLYKYGVEVFEDEENFETWLSTKSIALGGVKPKELFDTSFGINLVRDELTRIEHGVLA